MGVSLSQLTLRLMVRVRPRLVCLHLARPLVTTSGILPARLPADVPQKPGVRALWAPSRRCGPRVLAKTRHGPFLRLAPDMAAYRCGSRWRLGWAVLNCGRFPPFRVGLQQMGNGGVQPLALVAVAAEAEVAGTSRHRGGPDPELAQRPQAVTCQTCAWPAAPTGCGLCSARARAPLRASCRRNQSQRPDRWSRPRRLSRPPSR